MRAPNVCFVITEDWYFWSHRRILAEHLVRQGCRVDVVTNFGELQKEIESAGIVAHSVGLQRRSKNPVVEANVVRRMTSLFRELRPDVVHLVGMKPILYGSIAARIAQVPATVCAIAGLGWLFAPGGRLKTTARRCLQTYFRCALARRPGVQFIVQNSDHQRLLLEAKMASDEQVTLISGAGVDTERFAYRPEPNGTPVVLTHGRMLWDKGIGELIAAGRILKQRDVQCDFQLVGEPDPANPASIPVEKLKAWHDEGIVTWLGRRNDIPQLLAQAHVACLPSYHEGFPLSLVESSSCGRPIVTTDIPGCRDVVRDRESGLLVPAKDPMALATALQMLVEQPQMRRAMGANGRQRAVREMSSQIVNQQTFACYERTLGSRRIPVPRQPLVRPQVQSVKRAA